MTKDKLVTSLNELHTALRHNHLLEFEKFKDFNGLKIYTSRDGFAFSFIYQGVEFDYRESRNELEVRFDDYSDFLNYDAEKWLKEVQDKLK
jgi:hypothetical protein